MKKVIYTFIFTLLAGFGYTQQQQEWDDLYFTAEDRVQYPYKKLNEPIKANDETFAINESLSKKNVNPDYQRKYNNSKSYEVDYYQEDRGAFDDYNMQFEQVNSYAHYDRFAVSNRFRTFNRFNSFGFGFGPINPFIGFYDPFFDPFFGPFGYGFYDPFLHPWGIDSFWGPRFNRGFGFAYGFGGFYNGFHPWNRWNRWNRFSPGIVVINNNDLSNRGRTITTSRSQRATRGTSSYQSRTRSSYQRSRDLSRSQNELYRSPRQRSVYRSNSRNNFRNNATYQRSRSRTNSRSYSPRNSTGNRNYTSPRRSTRSRSGYTPRSNYNPSRYNPGSRGSGSYNRSRGSGSYNRSSGSRSSGGSRGGSRGSRGSRGGGGI